MADEFDNILNTGKELTKEEKELKELKEQKEVIDRIIRGVNDVFEKDYNLEDLGLKFKIKVKAPNALEIGQIQARVSSYLGGMNVYAPEYMLVAYQMLATLRVTGIEVPDFLKDDEKIYNLDILVEIGRDFQQWLSNFRF